MHNVKTILLLLLLFTVLISGTSFGTTIQLLENGDFENGLNGWNTNGDVTLGTNGNNAYLQGQYATMGQNTTVTTWNDHALSQDFFINNSIEEVTLSFNMVISGSDNTRFYDDNVDVYFEQLVCSYWNLTTSTNILEWQSPDSSNYNIGITYEATLSISDYLADVNPNASILFTLDEDSAYWFGDNTDIVLNLDNVSVTAEAAPVPEPASMILLGTGLIGLAGLRRRKAK